MRGALHCGWRRKTHYVLTTNGTPSDLGGLCLRITQVADIAGSIEALSTCFRGDAGPVIRPKWRRRQSVFIKQIAARAVAPSIADCHWHRHIETGYYDRDSIDRCIRPVELSVRTGDGETNQLATTVCFYATTTICKSNPDFVSFDCHRLVERSGIDKRLPVGCAQSPQSEPLPNLGLAVGVNILRISDIDRHCDPGIRNVTGR